jgi:hypothetical protein
MKRLLLCLLVLTGLGQSFGCVCYPLASCGVPGTVCDPCVDPCLEPCGVEACECGTCGPVPVVRPCGPGLLAVAGHVVAAPVRWVHGIFTHGTYPGCGCGEVYYGDYVNHPPDFCDPCDQCGNYIGPGAVCDTCAPSYGHSAATCSSPGCVTQHVVHLGDGPSPLREDLVASQAPPEAERVAPQVVERNAFQDRAARQVRQAAYRSPQSNRIR